MQAASSKGFEVFLPLDVEVDLDIRGRNCDRAVERSPALEECNELGTLLIGYSLQMKLQPDRVEHADVLPHRVVAIYCSGDC
jgi:hypothetical protein